jgi:hypothetical protein
MKNIFLVAIIFFIQVTISKAQDSTNKVPEFGEVDIAELQIKNYRFSPDAAAVNLLKYKKVELSIFPNGNTEVLILTRYKIKIFNKNGYNNANISIPFYGDKTTKIKNIKAATYNLDENGKIKVTTLEESDIFKIKDSKKNSRKSIKFTFPNIREGSVLEYQFVQKYKMGYGVPSWYFQDDIPNLLTVYEVKRPLLSTLQKRVVADLTIEETHLVDLSNGFDKRQLDDTYIMRNVPAFKSEAFMSSPWDYKYRIDFLVADGIIGYNHNNWFSANAWLLRLPAFSGVFDSKIPGTKSFIDSVKRLNNIADKIRSVYSYVKQKVKWVHVYYIFSRELDEVWNEGEGTSAEINLSILNLLRKCGVQCFPVLYSTRGNGKVDFTFPDLSQFNTVNIAVVNGKKFNLLDGTNAYLSYETPPFNVVNRTGLLIDPFNYSKINIDFDRKLIWDSIFVSASITSNGVLKGSIEKKYFDLAKSMKFQNSEKDEDEEGDNKNTSQTVTEIKVDSSWQVNIENELLPLIEHSTFHYELPVTNDFYFLNPFLFSDFSKNPFTDSIRISDIDFGASTASVVQIKIALPKGIKLEGLAKDNKISTPDSSIIFVYHNEIKNDSIYINSSIEIKKPIFNKQEYGFLKKIFTKIYSLLNNQILLQKKDEK